MRQRAARLPVASVLEATLDQQLVLVRLPRPEREACLIPGRRFRCDRVWRDARVVVEIEGGIYRGGRHTAVEGFIRDCEKYNLLALAGWCVLRVTERDIRTGRAVAWITEALQRSEDDVIGATTRGTTAASQPSGGVHPGRRGPDGHRVS